MSRNGYNDYPFVQGAHQQQSNNSFYPSYDGPPANRYSDHEDHARYPTNEYDQHSYATEADRGGHYRSNSYASDAGNMAGRGALLAAPLDHGHKPFSQSEMEMRSYGDADRGSGYDAYNGGVPQSTYKGNGIWSVEEKRAFSQRGTCGKILGPFFCVLILAIIITASAISLVLLFARPPNFALTGVSVPVPQLAADSFILNTTLDFTISNPNSISATLTHLNADITSKNVPNINVGKGSISQKRIEPHANTTIHFPLQISLVDGKNDPNHLVLADVSKQCGWTSGGGSGSLTLNIKVDASVSVLSVPITVPVQTTITPKCPSLSDITGIVGQLTGNSDLGSIISSVLGGGGASALSSRSSPALFAEMFDQMKGKLAKVAQIPGGFSNLFWPGGMDSLGEQGIFDEEDYEEFGSSRPPSSGKTASSASADKAATDFIPWSAAEWDEVAAPNAWKKLYDKFGRPVKETGVAPMPGKAARRAKDSQFVPWGAGEPGWAPRDAL